MKMCKLLSIALSVLIVLSTIPSLVIFAEEEKNSIYSENMQAIAGEKVLVPVKIKNNTGIAGFKLNLKYDKDYLTPVKVDTTTSILTQGLINDTIETSKDNTIDVLWSNTENIKDDGLLFNIEFDVNGQATDKTQIELSYSQADTFDENIKDVVLNVKNITLFISNKQYDSLSQITLSGSEVTAGETVKISGVVARKINLSSADISIYYDKNSFEYQNIKSLNNSEISNVSNNDGVLNFKISNFSENVKAFELEFKCSDFADSKEYLFSGNSNDVYIKPVKIKVNSSLTSDSPIIKSDNKVKGKFNEKLIVPVYIENNKGIMGYKLHFDFDKNLIKPIKIISSGLLNGNFENNIGLNEGKFDVVWSNSSELNKNGKIFDIEFEVLSQEIGNSLINISYSSADTFNEEYKDVTLVCNDINYSLNAPCEHKFTNYVSNNDATCLKDGTKTAVCDYGCGEKSTINDIGSKLGHLIVVINKSNPTYVNNGYTGDEICSNCKTIIKKGYVISKKSLKKPTIKLKTNKKKVIVSIKRVLGAQKYEIQIKIGRKWKKFSSVKLKKIIKNKSIKFGKKYTVRVRAVVTESGKKYYSGFSVKKIKIKK